MSIWSRFPKSLGLEAGRQKAYLDFQLWEDLSGWDYP